MEFVGAIRFRRIDAGESLGTVLFGQQDGSKVFVALVLPYPLRVHSFNLTSDKLRVLARARQDDTILRKLTSSVRASRPPLPILLYSSES